MKASASSECSSGASTASISSELRVAHRAPILLGGALEKTSILSRSMACRSSGRRTGLHPDIDGQARKTLVEQRLDTSQTEEVNPPDGRGG